LQPHLIIWQQHLHLAGLQQLALATALQQQLQQQQHLPLAGEQQLGCHLQQQRHQQLLVVQLQG
jgi:hypothetical protein